MTGRKALVRDYKDRKVTAGIYAVRCTASGEAWVGATPDLSTRQSGIWFSLKHGSHREPDLQAAWTRHGEAAFVFETVETLEDDTLGPVWRSSWFKAQREVWSRTLQAGTLNR